VLDTFPATRYVVPLREGGSLPAVLDTEHGGLFVAKFRGAGQGARALVAEIIVAGVADALGLPVPEVALLELDESFGRSERDPEIQDILRASVGLNFGMRYLEGALNFDAACDRVDPDLAARVVWLDAFVTNIDRTARNPNLMWWQERAWLIDHGAALYFHHDWESTSEQRARAPFPAIRDHVLLPQADDPGHVDAALAAALGPEVLASILDAVPDALLMDAPPGVEPAFATPAEHRDAYLRVLTTRLEGPRAFVQAARDAREAVLSGVRERKGYRR